MKKVDFISVILAKILNVVGIALGLSFTPIQYFYCNLQFGYGNFIALIIISIFIILFFWFGLLRTNNTVDRFNIFSINRRYKTKMEKSLNDDPSQIYRLDKPSEEEIKQKNREKKLKELGI